MLYTSVSTWLALAGLFLEFVLSEAWIAHAKKESESYKFPSWGELEQKSCLLERIILILNANLVVKDHACPEGE